MIVSGAASSATFGTLGPAPDRRAAFLAGAIRRRGCRLQPRWRAGRMLRKLCGFGPPRGRRGSSAAGAQPPRRGRASAGESRSSAPPGAVLTLRLGDQRTARAAGATVRLSRHGPLAHGGAALARSRKPVAIQGGGARDMSVSADRIEGSCCVGLDDPAPGGWSWRRSRRKRSSPALRAGAGPAITVRGSSAVCMSRPLFHVHEASSLLLRG